MSKPKISIITVCYNSESTIRETIESVLSQSYNNIEYIIIDGNSKDSTTDIIKSYSNGISYWISEQDKGIYDAMNKGIAVSTGDYIYFIGSDDVLYNDEVISNVASSIGNNRDSIFYGDVIFNPENIRYDGAFSKVKLAFKNICHQSMFFPGMLLRNNRYDLRYTAYSDWYTNILFMGNNIKFVHINQIIAIFKSGGTSFSGDEAFDNERGKIVYAHLGLLPYIYYLLRVRLVNFLKNFLNK